MKAVLANDGWRGGQEETEEEGERFSKDVFFVLAVREGVTRNCAVTWPLTYSFRGNRAEGRVSGRSGHDESLRSRSVVRCVEN